MKRVFLIVLDSFGIGEMEDAAAYGDFNVNTLRSVYADSRFAMPNMKRLGFFQIDGVGEALQLRAACVQDAKDSEKTVACDVSEDVYTGTALVARLAEASKGKDTTIGHWEIAGIHSENPLPTYPEGFPEEVIHAFCKATGRGVLCNKPYSGTEVIRDYGEQHMKTGDLIVYTSADSVFQIAAHEEVVPLQQLYEYCRIARKILTGEHGVGRVIARPFVGTCAEDFTRTSNRHDFSIEPPKVTMLDQLKEQGLDVIGVGKIHDIFAGKGLTEHVYTTGNPDGIEKTLEYMEKEFEGLCFVNLVDYDSLYGHRRDIGGYAAALSYFDGKLPEILGKMKGDDILMITADHGCDPGYLNTTDHTREYVPFVMYGDKITPNNKGTRKTFADIGVTVLQYFGIMPEFEGEGMLEL